MGKTKKFRPGEVEDYFEDTFPKKPTKVSPPPRPEIETKPKKEEPVMSDVVVKGTVVFGYKADNGEIKWFEEKQTRTSGDQRFLDTGRDLIRLYMKGIRLQTGYVLSWKNAFPETTK
jgi:hypothetical protein